MVMVTISELLTQSELVALLRLYSTHRTDGRFVELCRQQIIEPNLERINHVTKQENDAKYLADLLKLTLMAVESSRRIVI